MVGMTQEVEQLVSHIPPADEVRAKIQQATRELAALRSLLRTASRIEQVKASEQAKGRELARAR